MKLNMQFIRLNGVALIFAAFIQSVAANETYQFDQARSTIGLIDGSRGCSQPRLEAQDVVLVLPPWPSAPSLQAN